MYKAFGDDGTVYTERSISSMIANSATGIGIQLRSFQYAIGKIKEHPGIEKILIHKPGPLPDDNEYLDELAATYKRGLLEVDTFINAMTEKERNG